ncbi:hypothetical protein QUB19_25195 [Microcoleus sp. B4-C5]|uniref:hypothetical protein n=1 Tax=unclassified Microcoleus TaxID=2642155 RepID=UPI002FD0275F
MSSGKIQKKGRNYGFPSLDGFVGGFVGDFVGGFVDRVELLTVFAEFAVAF